MNRILFACVACLAILAPSLSGAATFEVPGDGGKASGVGYFSGWKCPPNNNITIVIDGGTAIPVATGIRRGDTASVCGDSGLNGYISQINFGNLGAGPHHASVRQNGVEFAGGTFTVTTFGTPFLSGASGTYTLNNFPSAGQSAVVQWSQGAQNFIITGTGSAPTPTPTPPSVAQVRFGNSVTCGGLNFTAIMSANEYSWESFTGVFSAYQSVNRSSLGPTTIANSTCGTFLFNLSYPILAGHRLAFVQTFDGTNVVLTEYDEGAVSSSENPTSVAAGVTEPLIAAIAGVAVGNPGELQ